MQEVFYEETAVVQNEKLALKKYNTIKMMSIFSYVAIGIWVFICLNFYFVSGYWLIDLLIVLVPAIVFLLIGILLGIAKNKFYVDYDYTFITGSIRISKVIKNVKRKCLIKFDTSNIEKLGKYGGDTYFKYEKMPGVKKIFLTSNNAPITNKDFYFLTVNHEGEKKLLVIEVSQAFIINIIKFSNKQILDEDFVKEISRAKS